jgi:hypothetical protein
MTFAQEPECGSENAMFSGRTIYVIAPLQLGRPRLQKNRYHIP